jgi:hypothetical protein
MTPSATVTDTSTPTPTYTDTATHTPTPTDTATPPPLALIEGLVQIDLTPLHGAPVDLGETSVSTDSEGKFQVQVPLNQDASISSGLKAIKFEKIAGEEREVLEGTGEQIASIAAQQGGVIVIDASRRVNPEPICRAYSTDTGAEVLWFRYTNRYGETLSVPQIELNTLMSPSGQPYPVSEFRSIDSTQPDGLYGFEWPIEFFTWFKSDTNQEMVSAAWKLLGAEVAVEQPREEVPLCLESGELKDCSRISQGITNRIFEQALSTVTEIAKESEKAKKAGQWRPKGNFRLPHHKQAARSLANIRKILRSLPTNRYSCTGSTPANCSVVVFPKAQILAEYQKIFTVKLPPGLQRLVKKYPGERRKFLVELRKHPERYVTCSR